MSKCVRSFLDYTARADVFEDAYEELLQELAER